MHERGKYGEGKAREEVLLNSTVNGYVRSTIVKQPLSRSLAQTRNSIKNDQILQESPNNTI